MTKVIAIVGMPGAGKSEAGEFFKNKRFQVLRFGSAVDEEIHKEGLEWSSENTAYFRNKLRKELGMAAVAIKMLPKIKKAMGETGKIVLDGLYSWEEYEYLQKELEVLILLCIYARPTVRYQRLSERKERPFTKEESRKRDIDEIVMTNKGGPIAIADYLIKNEGTKEEFVQELEKFLELFENDKL